MISSFKSWNTTLMYPVLCSPRAGKQFMAFVSYVLFSLNLRSMLPSDLQLMLKPDCKASVDVITEKYSGVRSFEQSI